MDRFNHHHKQNRGGRRGRGRGRVCNFYHDDELTPDVNSEFRYQTNPGSKVDDELAELREQAAVLYEQLRSVQAKLDVSSTPEAARAVLVDTSLCVGCGICVPVCPNNAIRMINGVAQIDQACCSNCGLCIKKCPRGAVKLSDASLS